MPMHRPNNLINIERSLMCSGFRFICCVVISVTVGCRFEKSDVHGLSLNAQSVQLTELLQKYVFRNSNYKSYIFLDIDNAGYICYAEA
jgi:hypothetical protein